MHNLKRAAWVMIAAALLVSRPAVAQYTQYTAPGEPPFPELPTRERLDSAMEQSRWRLGAIRLDPWVGLRDVGWIDNVFGVSTGPTTSDYTATLGLGVHAYTRMGPKVVVAAHALPEYVWWNRLSNRRVWNGRYGVGAFGFYNRVRFQATATTGRTMQNLSSEIESPVNVRRDLGAAVVEADIGGRLGVFAGGGLEHWRYREQDAPGEFGRQLLLLDRDENRLRGGLRYHVSDRFSVGVGVETSRVDFRSVERDRSSSGSGPMAELELDGARMSIRAVVLRPSLDPKGEGSRFVPFDDLVGRFQLRWRPQAKLEWQLYSHGNLVYSLEDASPYYLERRVGVGAQMPFGHSLAARAFVESGSNDFVAVPGGTAGRTDDVVGVGAGLEMTLYRQVKLRVGITRTKTDRGEALGDRTVTRIGFGVTVGESTSDWW